MSEYTPTTEQVREAFATRNAPVQDDARRLAFDRWLIAHDAEVCVEYESLRSAQVLVTQIEGKPASEWLAAHDAEVRAGVVAEEPEGAEVAFFTTLDGDYAEESATLAQAEYVRREAFGRIPVSERKITKRVIYWVPVKQGDES